MTDETTFREPKDPANRDPLTGSPGAHPVGVGVGAASGGVAGAAVGAIGGPVSAAVGAGLGAVVGGLAGKAAAESVNPTIEEVYWRENYSRTAYVEPGRPYSDYAPAYRFGWESAARCAGRTFDEMHDALAVDWEARRGTCALPWSRAKFAARDAWRRVRGVPDVV